MPPESLGNYGYAFNMNNCDTQSDWIIDSGATNHMTYDPTDLSCDTVPLRRNITNANGVTSPDILTKEIIGRGTKRGDLYFVDDVSTGRVKLTQRAVDHKRRQICSCYIRASTICFDAPTMSKGYHCYHPPSCQMYTTMDVTFSEFEMYFSSASSNPLLQGKTLHDEQVWTMAATTDLPLPLLTKLVMAALPAQPTEAASLPIELAAGTTLLTHGNIPPNDHTPENIPKEALFDDRWTKAMEEEMDVLQKNQTWDLVPDGYEEVWVQAELIYLSHTMPDIAYAISVVSQFMHSPSDTHIGAVECILQYLKSSPGRGIMFSKNGHCRIEGYTDADWAMNITDRRSTSGYLTFVGGNLVTWLSKKQKVVALSSAEVEYKGMAKGVCKLLWLRRLLAELGCPSMSATNLFCDNKAAIDISHNPIQHDRTKHVEVDRHFIKEKLDGNIIQFSFVKSKDQLADILTKVVASQAFYNFLVKLGMNDIYAPT
ncbi:hypothetical protein D8674_003716 [Pyrus ussuriensis x Pyrus communis]|uniref:Uncharacterized protein n=1 Tax=Pyrus ussuriensis x Pyrus communis TaxID=2448454 RepID=A0A5N5FM27_9ROSA|nr:hypothetical protein D8674_003716 [Pyrus ussuriensis x Pyrus communis]